MKSAMKWTTLCAAIATALREIWYVVVQPLLWNAGMNRTMTDAQIGLCCTVVNLIFTLSLVAFFTILFIRQK